MEDFRLLWNEFCKQIKQENRFFVDAKVPNMIKDYCAKNLIELKKDSENIMYRARKINLDRDLFDLEIEGAIATNYYTPQKKTEEDVISLLAKLLNNKESEYIQYHEDSSKDKEYYIKRYIEILEGFYGYNQNESGAPPASFTKHGRANPDGIPYLYLSQDIITCVSELRPSLKDEISIGEFKPLADLKIVDFFMDEAKMKKIKNDKKIFVQISFSFSRPAANNTDYYPTQYIAELIKSLGYDGISYESAIVENKRNYVFFCPDKLECEKSSLCKVMSINYIIGEQFPFEKVNTNKQIDNKMDR